MAAKSKPIVECLNGLVASMNVFARKVKHYHWSVKGPNFFTLHAKFEELYDEAAEWADELAERVVALGAQPLATSAEDLKLSAVKEDAEFPAADAMVKNLVADIETLKAEIHKGFEIAEKADDRSTEDLLDDVRDGLDAREWMFKSYLG
jgi:starvation-inducible DNA-binding protein